MTSEMGRGRLASWPCPALTLSWCPQEAAAIIAQRPDNPREFFRQQERVASASAGSCDVPSPFNHRPGSPWPCPCPTHTPQTMALRPFGTTPWKTSLAQGLPGEGKTPSVCFRPQLSRWQHPQRGWVGGPCHCWALAEQWLIRKAGWAALV